MARFLQINLNRSRAAQAHLAQMANTIGANVLLVSEQNNTFCEEI